MASYGRGRRTSGENSSLFKNDRFLPPLDPKDDVFTFNPPDSDIKDKENPRKQKHGPIRKMTADKKKNALRDTTKGRKNRGLLPTNSELDEYGSDTSSIVGHNILVDDVSPSSSKQHKPLLSSLSSSSSSSLAHGGGYAAPAGMTFKPLVSAVDEATDDDEGLGSPKRPTKRPRKTKVVEEKAIEEEAEDEAEEEEEEENQEDEVESGEVGDDDDDDEEGEEEGEEG